MKTHRLYLTLFILHGTLSLAQPVRNHNPAAPGFDAAGSDARAVQIADAVMAAMGGRAAWDETPLIAWTFDGMRKFVWDKWSGDVRIDNLLDDQTILFNSTNNKGRVYRNGDELTQPDSVIKYVRLGKREWLNDAYWLLMPFKLKESGVTLRYLGYDLTQERKPADALQVVFKPGTVMAGGKYKLWVDKKSRLVTQWAYYPKLTDTQPIFTLPWEDYEQHGNILLSSDRGERQITDIMVFTGLPGEVFSDFTRTDLSRYIQPK